MPGISTETFRFQYNGNPVEFSGTSQQVAQLRAKVDSGSPDRTPDGLPIMSQQEFLALLGTDGRSLLNTDLTLKETAFTAAGQRALSDAISRSLGNGHDDAGTFTTLAGRLATL